MSATVHGVAYVYGIGATAPSNSTIISLTLAKSDANEQTVEDHAGGTITVRTDDQRDAIDMELKFTASFLEPAIGSVLTIADSHTPSTAGEYMVQTVTLTAQNKDFKTYKVTALKREYLDLTP